LWPHARAMAGLDAHAVRRMVNASKANEKQIIFIRHGQSVANSSGHLSEEEPLNPRWWDSPITAKGQMQASSWAGVAPSWDVDEVWCSPLCRAMETACRIFERVDVPIRVSPFAREGWWHCTENQGRLLQGIRSGTDGTGGEERLWPTPEDWPNAHKLTGLEGVAASIPDVWDPAGERSLQHDEEALFEKWKASLERFKAELMASEAPRIAVVCHWGVVEALAGIDADNCALVPTVAHGDCLEVPWTCAVCPPIETHPPIGIRGYDHVFGDRSRNRSPRSSVVSDAERSKREERSRAASRADSTEGDQLPSLMESEAQQPLPFSILAPARDAGRMLAP